MARRFLAGLTMETKAGGSTERRGDPKAISRAISASPGAMSLTGMGAVGQWDIDLAVRNGLERVIWIYRCTDVIAQNQARITIHQKQQRPQNRGQGKIIDNPELWRLLNFRPNTYESSFMFRYRLSVLLLLARRGAFIEIVPGKGGKGAAPAELHLLPPGRTEPIPDPKKFVGGYKITRQDGIDELPPERVIWLRLKPHPTDPYAQMTPLVAAGIEADTDFLARTFNRNFLANDGRPGSLIVVDGGPAGISDEDAALLKQRYGMGPAYAGLTTIVEAMGITAQDMSSTPRDTQWQELMATSKERLLLAFGVPESVMGNASGRTFDNADAERENFWNDTMLTHCDAIGTGLDPLTGDDNDDTILAFNYDEVDVLQRVKRTQREEWRTELSAGGITLNEYRKRNGQPEIDSPGARAYYLPNGVVVAERQDEQEEMAKLTVLGAQPVDPAAAAQQGALEGATQGAASGNRELGNMLAARIAQMGKGYVPKMLERKTQPTPEQVVIEAEVVEPVHPYEGTRNRVEGQVEGALILWDQTQSRVVSDRLGHVKCRRGTRHWDGEEVATKALDADYAADLNEWAESLAQGIEQAVGGAVRREYRREVANIKATGVLQVLDGNPYSAIAQQKAVDAILKNATGLAREAAKNQVTRIRTRIKELDQEGASLADIKSEVQLLISGRSEWRKTLSTQITTQALEAARAAAHAPVSGLYTKTWNTVGDNHVRGSHRQVNRKTIPVPDKFSVGVSKLMFPGDPTGAVEDVINCRCFLSYRIDPKRANGR